jgi:hypothetical protein
MDTQKLLKAQGIVFVMVALGVGLFLLVYALAESLPSSSRLFMALCLPPMILAVLFGGAVLFLRRGE